MSFNQLKLDDLGTLSRGRSRHRPRDAKHLYGGPYPFIQTGNVKHSNLFINSYSQTYSEAGLAQSKLWPQGTLCITIAANIADTAILDMEACFPDSIIGFIADENKANTFYIKYLFDFMLQKRFQKFSHGATQDNLSQTKLLSIDFTVPALQTQNKIAFILSAYDKLIKNNRRRIELLEKSAQLLYKEWFIHLRFPGHEHTNIIDGVPEGWERITFGDLTNVNKGKNITKKKAIEGDIPVVAGGLEPSYYHNEPNVEGPSITVSASGANAGYVNLYHSDIWSSDSSYIKSCDDKETYFLYLMLKIKQKHIFAMQRGAAQPHVYPKDLNRLEVLIPLKRIKSLFEEYIEPIFVQIEKLEKLNENSRRARDLLLPKLMNGDIAV